MAESSLLHGDALSRFDVGFPATLSRTQTRRVLLALLVLVILPRAWVAWQLNAVCNDAYYYQWVATMWEQGRTATALKYLNVNVYPLILWGLKSAGLPWPLGGMLWGLLVSGLTVFPLFGLMRRLFDDRVAAVSAFLFAIHPGLIELAAEPIRDPTFWFLFVLAAYWIYCCATASGGWMLAPAAGMATALAIHTRTEGWALLVLLFAWPLTIAPPGVTRLRRVLRIVLALAMVPALLVAANLTVLRDHDRWEWGRFAPLRSFVKWLPVELGDAAINRRALAPGLIAAERVQRAKQPVAESCIQTRRVSEGRYSRQNSTRLSLADASGYFFQRTAGARRLIRMAQVPNPAQRAGEPTAYVFVNQLAEEFEYLNLVFLLIGVLAGGRLWLARGRLPLPVVFGGILLAVWVRLSQTGGMNARYFLTAYLLALPTEAMGLLFVATKLRAWIKRTSPDRMALHAVAPALAVGLAGVFWFKACTQWHAGRDGEVLLGLQIRERHRPLRVETDRAAVRVGHIALGSFPVVSFDDEGDGSPPPEPDVIIAMLPVPASLRERAARCGLVEATPTDDSPYLVFVRPPGVKRIARQSDRLPRP